MRKTKSGQAQLRTKTYIYAPLQFLKHILDSGYSESSLHNDGKNDPVNRIEDEAGIDIGTTETQPVLEDQSVSASTCLLYTSRCV